MGRPLVGSRFVRRVSVVGDSGSGKSTLGRQLAGRLAVPYVELDAIFHQPHWTPLPEEQFRHRVAAIASGDGWVIDGNYSAVRPLVWERADTVVWLDPPRRTVMRRIIWRSVRRAGRRTELWNGNRERWRNLFAWDEQESIIVWAWRRHPVYRQRYADAARDPGYAHLTFRRITTHADARQLLDSARPLGGAGGEP
jgi:adenylate kinase family enzyme